MQFRSGYTSNPFENLKIINAAAISDCQWKQQTNHTGTQILTIMYSIFQVKSTIFALKLQKFTTFEIKATILSF